MFKAPPLERSSNVPDTHAGLVAALPLVVTHVVEDETLNPIIVSNKALERLLCSVGVYH